MINDDNRSVDWDRRCDLAKRFMRERIQHDLPKAIYVDMDAIPEGKSIYDFLEMYNKIGFMVWRRWQDPAKLNPYPPVQDIDVVHMFEEYCERHELGWEEEGVHATPFPEMDYHWKSLHLDN